MHDNSSANYCIRTCMHVFITHAAIVKEQGEFGWIMSTAIVIAPDYHSAVILDGESKGVK